MLYMIGYDLNKPGQDYTPLFDAIKAMSNAWWHYLDSTWLIESSYSAEQIRDHLSTVIDMNDELLVAAISAPAAWVGFSDKGSEWLSSHLRRTVGSSPWITR